MQLWALKVAICEGVFKEIWDQDAFQLVDWQKSVLRMVSREAGNIARQLADILQESAKPAVRPKLY